MRGKYWETIRFGVLLIFIMIIFVLFDRKDLSLAMIIGFVLICGCKFLTDYQERKKVES